MKKTILLLATALLVTVQSQAAGSDSEKLQCYEKYVGAALESNKKAINIYADLFAQESALLGRIGPLYKGDIFIQAADSKKLYERILQTRLQYAPAADFVVQAGNQAKIQLLKCLEVAQGSGK